jgi:hypothetical protein
VEPEWEGFADEPIDVTQTSPTPLPTKEMPKKTAKKDKEKNKKPTPADLPAESPANPFAGLEDEALESEVDGTLPISS